jgi:hypothetical protein
MFLAVVACAAAIVALYVINDMFSDSALLTMFIILLCVGIACVGIYILLWLVKLIVVGVMGVMGNPC